MHRPYSRFAAPLALVALSALVASGSVGARHASLTGQDPPALAAHYDDHFTDRTMRVDYFHTGRAAERILTLDQVVDDGPWPGSRTQLVDDTNLGKYLFEVRSQKTDRLLYSRGFASLYGEWETVPAAMEEWRTFHDSLRFPWPNAPVKVVLHRRNEQQEFERIWITPIDPGSRFVNTAPAEPQGRVWTLFEHGPPGEKVDLLLIGEGYTKQELWKFHEQAKRLVEALFAEEPFKSRRSDFNVRAIELPSPRPGVHRPQAGQSRRTPTGVEYNIFDSERYLLTQDNRAMRDIASAAPYEFIEILVNEEHYGGGGIFNAHATASAGNPYAEYLFIHEFAHHFAALADEYYTSDVAYATGGTEHPEPWEPNVTAQTDRARLKWGDLVAPDTPVPTPWSKAAFEEAQKEYQATRRTLRETGAPEAEMTALFDRQQELEMELFGADRFASRVGAFEGASYEAVGLYRPEIDCIMFSRNPVGFCRVCQRAISQVIDLYTR
jgi:hypothetical protein